MLIMKHYYLLFYTAIALVSLDCFGQNTAKFCSPVTISIRAIDMFTQKEVPAQFDIHLTKSHKRLKSNPQYAVDVYHFSLFQADSVYILAKSEGYYETEDFLVIEHEDSTSVKYSVMMERDIPFEELKVNEVKKLDKIYFEQGSFLLNPKSIGQLTKLYVALRDNPKMKIQIAGHSDNVGNLKINHFLSENRAKVICSFLIEKGIQSNRLQFVGYGHTKPATENDTEENRSANRRVEVLVMER
jgi:OOP family OmpA-OmpF porin